MVKQGLGGILNVIWLMWNEKRYYFQGVTSCQPPFHHHDTALGVRFRVYNRYRTI